MTDTLKSSMMHLRLSVLESRVVCGGITVMPMVSVVASDGHSVRTYGADGIFWCQKLCILPHTLVEDSFQKTFMIDKISNTHLP